ncbi:MAG: multifunctional CCA addition/repair protein [Methylococcaceae bacterium]|nr:MAG: multifunctional CCA addition/repair protein [Methylococcaceae bacterium]
MKKYLVGGAIRDKFLGRAVQERDWVVVGETPESMLAQGFRPVGRDFPVFLHPHTREEHALARTERKTAPGYRGFEVQAHPAVSLEDDLKRRDFTINAMAEDETGLLIDPYGGRQDLDARVLRHVSPAFQEDPVRILRAARFMARYERMGFRVAEETMALMRGMVHAGEVDALVAERVWAELVKALSETAPAAFFRTLAACDALQRLFPEIHALFGVPQPPQYHPEIDTGEHTLLVLEQAARLSPDPIVRFAALTHDLGKALTPEENWPSHHGHETLGLTPLKDLCWRIRVPNDYRALAEKVMRHHGRCHHILEMRASSVVDLLQALDAFRRPEWLTPFLLACQADSQGRAGLQQVPYPQADFLGHAHRAALDVSAQGLLAQGYEGVKLGEELRRRRINAVKALRSEQG